MHSTHPNLLSPEAVNKLGCVWRSVLVNQEQSKHLMRSSWLAQVALYPRHRTEEGRESGKGAVGSRGREWGVIPTTPRSWRRPRTDSPEPSEGRGLLVFQTPSLQNDEKINSTEQALWSFVAAE